MAQTTPTAIIELMIMDNYDMAMMVVVVGGM